MYVEKDRQYFLYLDGLVLFRFAFDKLPTIVLSVLYCTVLYD